MTLICLPQKKELKVRSLFPADHTVSNFLDYVSNMIWGEGIMMTLLQLDCE